MIKARSRVSLREGRLPEFSPSALIYYYHSKPVSCTRLLRIIAMNVSSHATHFNCFQRRMKSCSTAVSEMHHVVKIMLRGLYSKVDEVSRFLKGAVLGNAGGRVNADALGSIMVLDCMAGVGTVMVVYHTDDAIPSILPPTYIHPGRKS